MASHGAAAAVTPAAPPPPRLNLGIYNIQDGHGFSLLRAPWAVQMENYDIMLLIETKILDMVYCKNPPRLRCRMLKGVHQHSRRSTKGCGDGNKGEAGGMVHQVHMLPWTKCGELQDCLQLVSDPPHCILPLLSTLDHLPDLECCFPGR